MRPEVAAIVQRLLAKHPAARFASAAELLAHLDAACVPVAIPVGSVDFNLPAGPYAPDSGYLTGRYADPSPGSGNHAPLDSGGFVVPVAEPSPWAQLTDESPSDTVATEVTAPPHKAAGRSEPVPLWMTATLLVGAVVLCMTGIGAVVKLMVK